MNIALFLNKDIQANTTYNILKNELSKHNLRIYFSEKVGKASKKPEILTSLEYLEKGYVYGRIIEFLKLHRINTSYEFFTENFTAALLQQCPNPNDAEFIREMREFEPDLFISVRYGHIFRDAIINIPKKGILNLHSGILPDFRGIMGTLHAMKEGREQVGCTLHYIPSSGIDTGEIIDVATLDVQQGKSLFWHILSIYPLGAALIARALKEITNGATLPVRIQDLAEGRYFTVPAEHDFNQLKSRGFNIISIADYIAFFSHWVSEDLAEYLSKDEELKHEINKLQ